MIARGAVIAGSATIILAAGACGTADWTFDADQSIGPVEAAAVAPDAASVEAGPQAESGAIPETSVPEADVTETAAADAYASPDSSADAKGEAEAACAVDSDCTAAGLHCDPASGECVECVSSADCGQGLACESLQCVTSCADAAPCPAATPICNEHMACVPCTTNSECANAAAGTGRRCLSGTGQCVQCLGDSDCSEGYCNQNTNACVH